ncbi:TIGR00730 family Rossman fold protein [Pseudomonas oryzihabitans]|uniref:Cytokinin riboside 5'-monophosphate phosphoribohydrolase n=1 Tax=Pseudomonas oryzihabitans TaxID=47885 RepID=A0AAJ2EX52_9PSED|nr:TIGR00730 family Rossman fold protein [Pseudomonas psychrotolerans]MDR6235169.1 uncharacterized protein (TIGR00730 family) [Pseudomonas psychrotolerans]MDR6355611.1 uncharacterized protein (TIGR00730 family) [Pseudomonas psychrotolerans]
MRLCIFCGSSLGRSVHYEATARELGRRLARAGIGVVYGGASIGLMGALADAVLEEDGEVLGVIPQALADKEIAHRGLTQLHIVTSMHERKALMAELADGFIALPGGIGTFEELFEMLTWAQLGYHAKPCALLNVNGFYDSLLTFLQQVSAQGFLQPQHLKLLMTAAEVDSLLERLLSVSSPKAAAWPS